MATPVAATKQKASKSQSLTPSQPSSSEQINLGTFPPTQTLDLHIAVLAYQGIRKTWGSIKNKNLLDRAILFLECITFRVMHIGPTDSTQSASCQ
jgi:hypothetical protein